VGVPGGEDAARWGCSPCLKVSVEHYDKHVEGERENDLVVIG
jgi:hypothetical protein